MKRNKMMDPKLTNDEEKIDQDLLSGEYDSGRTEDSKAMWTEAIANHRELSQTKQMTMRVDAGDLIKVKVKAKENNMPYQTLLKILFKQFAEGKVKIEV